MTAGRIYGLVMVALCAAICVVVVGCGSGGDDSGGSAATSTAPAGKAEQAGVEKSPTEADESGADSPEPGNESATAATQVQDRLKAAGYPVQVEPAAPKTVGVYGVPFEGGPAKGGYSITAYIYESADVAAAELEAFEAAFGAAAPGAIEVSVVDTRLYLAAAGPSGAVPAGALEEFVKVAEGT